MSFEDIVLDDGEDPRFAGLIQRWERAGLEVRLVATPTGALVVARHSEAPGRAVSSGIPTASPYR